MTASRSPLALKDVKCCSVSDVSSWPQPHFSAGATSEPCWRPYYEINPCRQWGEAHQLHFNSISSGMLSFTLFWRCSCKQCDTHSPLGVSFAGMHSNEFFFFPLLAYPLEKISFPEFTLPILFIKLSFLIYSDEAVRMTLVNVCSWLKCTHFKHCSCEEWVATFRHSRKNNMPGPNVKYNDG